MPPNHSENLYFARNCRRAALFLLLLGVASCAPPPRPVAASQPVAAPSLPTAVVIAVRTDNAADDRTGTVSRIMQILGYQGASAASATEILLRLPDGSCKTHAQPGQNGFAAGQTVVISATPGAPIQPYAGAAG